MQEHVDLEKAEDEWGISSAGRARALQAWGQRFDPAILHHKDCKEFRADTKMVSNRFL